MCMNKELFMVFITFIVCIFRLANAIRLGFRHVVYTIEGLHFSRVCFFLSTYLSLCAFSFAVWSVILYTYGTDGIVVVIAEREFKFSSSLALKLFCGIILLLLLWLFLNGKHSRVHTQTHSTHRPKKTEQKKWPYNKIIFNANGVRDYSGGDLHMNQFDCNNASNCRFHFELFWNTNRFSFFFGGFF